MLQKTGSYSGLLVHSYRCMHRTNVSVLWWHCRTGAIPLPRLDNPTPGLDLPWDVALQSSTSFLLYLRKPQRKHRRLAQCTSLFCKDWWGSPPTMKHERVPRTWELAQSFPTKLGNKHSVERKKPPFYSAWSSPWAVLGAGQQLGLMDIHHLPNINLYL